MKSDIEFIHSDAAPEAVGPYSQAVNAGGVLYCSGQLPLDPATTTLVEGDMGVKTRQIFANLSAVLEAAGATLQDVVSTQVFVTDLGEFAELNAVYAECFGDHKPARATIEVSGLPLGATVEIACTAVIGASRDDSYLV
jgi:2-iminobutanoate/2-iminopropanoate deaminase